MSKIKQLWADFKKKQAESGDDYGDSVPVEAGIYTCQVVGGEIKELGDDEITKAVVKLQVLEAEDASDVGKVITDFWNLEHEIGYKIACQVLKKMGAGDDDTECPEAMEGAFAKIVEDRVCVRVQVKPSKKDDSYMQVHFKRVVEVDDAAKVDPDEKAGGKPKGKTDDDDDDNAGRKGGSKHEAADADDDEIAVGSKVKTSAGKEGEVVDVDGDEITVSVGGKKKVFDRSDLELVGHAFDGSGGDAKDDDDAANAPPQEIEPGDEVEWKVKGPKGKPVTCYGKVVSVNKKKGSAKVVDGDDEERVVPYGDLTLQSA